MRDFKYGHFHELELEVLRDIEDLFRKSRREYLSRTTPSQRFKDCLRRNCLMVQCNNEFQDNVWSWNDSVVFEIERASWDESPDSASWLWYWRRAYVVDSKRGSGVFCQFCKEIQEWCDKSGVAICFVAKSFGFGTPADSGGILDFTVRPAIWLETVKDVSCAWNQSLMSSWPDDWLVDFYRSRGFENCRITFPGLCEDPESIPLERQFVYVGSEADWRVRETVRRRLSNE